MKVLGYNGGLGGYPQKFGAGHDSAAALVVDGQAVAACEEERLNREKHSGKFPRLAIAYCLKEAGVGSIAELDLVTYFYSLPLMFRKEILTQNQEGLTRLEKFSASSILRTMRSYNKLVGYTNERSRLEFERHTVARLGDKKYVVIPHHLCHVASAFYDSPYDSALCVTLDGAGESTCSMVAEAKDTSIKVLREVFVPNSLGLLYGMMTSYLGFQIDSDEYKVMGLAPYGDRGTVRDFFSSILTRRNDGGYQLDQRFILGMAIAHNRLKMRIAMPRDEERVYPPFVLEALGPPRKPGEVITQRHMDIAAALQESLEGAVLHLLEHLRRRTGHRYLCMAGGVALNSTMNGKIARSGLFEGVWVHPAAHDAGTSLGAALFGYHNVLHRPRSVQRQHHCYLGPEYGPHEIDATLAQFSDKITYQRPDDLLPMVARALAEGKVVGWYRGRMEWGPRALGNRSILADPRRDDMKDIVNHAVKMREGFRPFAPACLAEKASQWFDMKGLPDSPFMLFVVPVREDQRARIPAVTHVDGSARVQTVSAEDNPHFHALISEFERLTGVPVLLNTSFNVIGEPIVNTPADAMRCFLGTQIDLLVLHDVLIEKRPEVVAALVRERGSRQRDSGRVYQGQIAGV